MKNRKVVVVVIGCLVVGILFSLLTVRKAVSALHRQEPSQLKLQLNTNKQNYVLGELIQITPEIVNESSETITFLGFRDVQSGLLKVSIGQNDGRFKRYYGPGWGLDCIFPQKISLNSKSTLKIEASILWNPVQKTSHLSEIYAKQIADEHIMTSFAITEPGVYRIKASYVFAGKNAQEIQSEPVQIVVDEPAGDDLEVWNIIKDNGEFAFFIQQGSFITSKPEERENLIKKLNEIVEKHPNSIHTERIKQNLIAFRRN